MIGGVGEAHGYDAGFGALCKPRRPPVVGVQHGQAPPRQRLEQLREHRGRAFLTAEVFGVGETDVRDDAEVGLRDVAQRCDVAWEALPHLGHDRRGRAGRVQQRDREPELVVVRLRARMHSMRSKRRREEILGRSLPGRARNADDPHVAPFAPYRPGDGLQSAHDVGGEHERVSFAHVDIAEGPLDQRDARAGTEGVGDEVVTVSIAHERDEARSGFDGA